MARATIIVDVNSPGEVQAAEDWFAAWRHRLTHCSDNNGCGCCVDSFDIEGPDDVIVTLPPEINSWSEWSTVRGVPVESADPDNAAS